MEVNETLCGLSFEIGCDGTKAEGRHFGRVGRVDDDDGGGGRV
jgi:hypothetical protein